MTSSSSTGFITGNSRRSAAVKLKAGIICHGFNFATPVPFAVLISSHRSRLIAQGLFEQVKVTVSERQRRQLYKKIKVELETHTYIEEKVLYPSLKKYEEFKEIALEAIEEHLQVKTLLRDIDRLPEGSGRFDPKLTVLMENVNHHIEKEEGEMFPEVEGRFSEEQLRGLVLMWITQAVVYFLNNCISRRPASYVARRYEAGRYYSSRMSR